MNQSPLFRDLAEQIGEGPSAQRREEVRRRLMSSAADRPSVRTKWFWGSGVAVVAASLLLWGSVGGGGKEESRERPTALSEPASVEGTGSQVFVLEHGARFELSKGSDAHIAHRDSGGVRWDLTDGQLKVDIPPRTGKTWRVAAGPFVVEVVGTAFAASYEEKSQVLEVEVEHGVVLVRGGSLGAEGARLEKGDRLVVSAHQAPDAEPPQEHEGQTIEAPAAKREPSTRRWTELARRGEHEAAMKSAQDSGLEQALASASLEELKVLADSARYAGRFDVAARAHTMLRARFSGSAAASLSAFLLGRMAADAGRAQEADRWFATYLREAPEGALSQEALGRRLLLAPAGPGTAELARTYLARFPEGAHAGRARRLLGEHD